MNHASSPALYPYEHVHGIIIFRSIPVYIHPVSLYDNTPIRPLHEENSRYYHGP
jgi:hypothetical protein